MITEVSKTITFKLNDDEKIRLEGVLVCEIRVRVEPCEENPEEDFVDVEFCGWTTNKDGSKRKSSTWRKIWPGIEAHNEWEARARQVLIEEKVNQIDDA